MQNKFVFPWQTFKNGYSNVRRDASNIAIVTVDHYTYINGKNSFWKFHMKCDTYGFISPKYESVDSAKAAADQRLIMTGYVLLNDYKLAILV